MNYANIKSYNILNNNKKKKKKESSHCNINHKKNYSIVFVTFC